MNKKKILCTLLAANISMGLFNGIQVKAEDMQDTQIEIENVEEKEEKIEEKVEEKPEEEKEEKPEEEKEEKPEEEKEEKLEDKVEEKIEEKTGDKVEEKIEEKAEEKPESRYVEGYTDEEIKLIPDDGLRRVLRRAVNGGEIKFC